MSSRTTCSTVCKEEGIEVDSGVLSLVVRSGAGSVRDSLSVLDQLIGGAEADTLDVRTSSAVAGISHPLRCSTRLPRQSLILMVLQCLSVVESVIDGGLDPERFMKDLLERLRDLVIIAAVEDAFEKRLITVADDQRDRLQSQADRIGYRCSDSMHRDSCGRADRAQGTDGTAACNWNWCAPSCCFPVHMAMS